MGKVKTLSLNTSLGPGWMTELAGLGASMSLENHNAACGVFSSISRVLVPWGALGPGGSKITILNSPLLLQAPRCHGA